MTHTIRVPFTTLAATSYKALYSLSTSVHEGSLGERLIALVVLRVSQINGCGSCVDMHWNELVRQDVSPRHINAVVAWREAPFFSERERAALHWAELVTAIPHSNISDEEFAKLQQHFSDAEIAELGFAIASINAWNLLNVSFRKPILAQA